MSKSPSFDSLTSWLHIETEKKDFYQKYPEQVEEGFRRYMEAIAPVAEDTVCVPELCDSHLS